MNRIRKLRVLIISFAFGMLYLSALLGIGLIILLSSFGIQTEFTAQHTTFILITLLISTVVGTFVTAIIGNHVFKPIEEVVKATMKVAKGDFSHHLTIDEKRNFKINQLISSFNRMTEELSEIEMFHNDFINNFSHEFKTPISSIMGYAKELKRADLSEQEKEAYLSIIISESERLSTLSSNILLLTNLENQKKLSNKSEFSLDEQLRKCILLLQKSWEEKNIEWDLQLDEVTCYAYEDLLSQAWLNLLSNAIKFSNNEGKIAVSCHFKNNKQIEVVISDNGIGMDEKTLTHAFDKFYQGDTSHSTKGNGLGLSLVKKIVELLKGEIDIQSTIHHGTTIIVQLPKNNA